jgi:NAD(P)-dependent dehydrogenase (short-subunit alcohol dehydrogenase family)
MASSTSIFGRINFMKNKIVLITGANSGLGLVTATRVAELGAEIVLVCRDPVRGAAARRRIATAATGKPPTLLLADVSSQASIRALAAEVHGHFPRLDVLINNAGGIFDRRELTVDGIEKTFATNYLAPFLLTHLLLDLLQAAPASRVVNIASALHGARLSDLDNLQGEKRYNFMQAYKLSKFSLIVFTYALARRLAPTRIMVNCVEPGPTKTRFGDNMTGLPSLFPRVMKLLPLFRPPEVGARTPVYVASSPDIEGSTGQYYVKCKPAHSKPITHDIEVAACLWTMSERLTGPKDGTNAIRLISPPALSERYKQAS